MLTEGQSSGKDSLWVKTILRLLRVTGTFSAVITPVQVAFATPLCTAAPFSVISQLYSSQGSIEVLQPPWSYVNCLPFVKRISIGNSAVYFRRGAGIHIKSSFPFSAFIKNVIVKSDKAGWMSLIKSAIYADL